jgi:hypothetical protein
MAELYYGGNYKKLQEAKGRWDPHQVFNHALSVEPGVASQEWCKRLGAQAPG